MTEELDSFFWTFQDGEPATSNLENPTTIFSTPGTKELTLKVTDSDGFSCSKTKYLVSTRFGLPKWKEIAPW